MPSSPGLVSSCSAGDRNAAARTPRKLMAGAITSSLLVKAPRGIPRLISAICALALWRGSGRLPANQQLTSIGCFADPFINSLQSSWERTSELVIRKGLRWGAPARPEAAGLIVQQQLIHAWPFKERLA